MQQVFLSGESNLLKTPMPTCINQMYMHVLQLILSTEHTLQVQNLSPFSLKTSNPDIVNFFLGLSSYFVSVFLKELSLLFRKFLKLNCAIPYADHLI